MHIKEDIIIIITITITIIIIIIIIIIRRRIPDGSLSGRYSWMSLSEASTLPPPPANQCVNVRYNNNNNLILL